jgi:hypothetical protein
MPWPFETRIDTNDNKKEPSLLPFATGNWGSGVFGGDPQLKSLIQWLACSYVGRDLIYKTFGDDNMVMFSSIVRAIERCNIVEGVGEAGHCRRIGDEQPYGVSVGTLYKWIVEYKDFRQERSCFEYIMMRLQNPII